ncbi:transposase [Komagataeibacter intermedius AF2]|uniref:Transposase n=2 Tax=Komagataeibacter intermedius TaxID=66229 RepID=A0A0N0ME03_9PROT|nr:transposase [Komagataeibacter intermedius AF2]GBQ69784.1 transposase [Komagataeibacter intermedius NRIC 0521]
MRCAILPAQGAAGKWCRRLMRRFVFQAIHDVCLMLDREGAAREATPSGGVIDSQGIKAAHYRRYGWPPASGQADTGRYFG